MSVAPKSMERAMMGHAVRNECYAGVSSFKALLRSLDSYPVSNGEPAKGFRLSLGVKD